MDRLRDRIGELIVAGREVGEKLGEEVVGIAENMLRRLESDTPCSDIFALEFVETSWRLCMRLKREKEHCKRNSGDRRIRVERSKLEAVTLLLPSVLDMPIDDLFNLKRSHPRWRSLLSQVEYIPCKDLAALQRNLSDLHRLMFLSGSALALGLQTPSLTMKKLLTGSGLVYYGVRTEEALQQGKLNAACPTVAFLRLFLGLAESSLCASVYDSLLPDIALSKKVYIPREMDMMEVPGENRGDILSESNDEREHVAIRVISPFPIPRLQAPPVPSNWVLCCPTPDTEDSSPPTSIILHIHGGGWMTMSSHTHENHTRKWAISTNCVVLSVDYRLAPEWPYPAAVEDCWTAYLWVRKYAQRHLGISVNKVIITGDSAGGSLALAVSILTIQHHCQPPDGLLLLYPCLSLDITRPSPSYLYSLEDLVLSHGVMRLARESYLTERSDPGKDPLLSPLYASDEVLGQLPKVCILIGSNDPLVDDAWRFYERLQQLHTPSSLTIFEGLSHGLLNFDFKLGLPEAQEAVLSAGQKLRELLSSP